MTDRTASEQAAEALRKKIPELKERVLKFSMLELPGQPQGMHMGTSYLVGDLLQTVVSFDEALGALTAEAARDPNYGAKLIAGQPLPKSCVSPDREAPARRLEIASGAWRMNFSSLADLLDEATVALRLPAQAEVEAWAVIDEGGINVKTISDTRLAAIINWLVVTKELAVFARTTSETIERMWHVNKDSAKVERILVSRLSSLPLAVGEWRDIESAPKSTWPQNGRVIILGRAGEWAMEGFWVTSEDERKDFWASDYNSDDGEWTPLPGEPTHWRECVAPPAPPQETKPT